MGHASDTTRMSWSGRLRALAPWLVVAAGLVLLATPVFSDWLYTLFAEREISQIEDVYDSMSDPERLQNLEQARAWNARLLGQPYQEPVGGIWEYENQLTYRSTPASMMAWLSVPKIGIRLPIYHGTGAPELMAGAGHCSWSALPVGGAGTRCVLTAHSGMQNTRMFDDIRRLELGDCFVVWTLGEPYAYRVTSVEVYLPEEAEQRLGPVEGQDLCTLVTCTPFGVNSHRLLVTGERTEYLPEMEEANSLEPRLNRRTIPLLVGLAALLPIVLWLVWKRRRR